MEKRDARSERFQVDLKGLMEVLAKHLYSSREVFVRELIQNAADAITARRAADPGFTGGLVVFEPDPRARVLTVTDEGIGLTPEQVLSALSCVGGSTKRGEGLGALRGSLIGQFGIGMLSCFMVADEIVVLTRAAGEEGPGTKWVGRSDGTYTVSALERPVEPGTRVTVRLSEDAGAFAEYSNLKALVERYGRMLPIPIVMRRGTFDQVVTRTPPWECDLETEEGVREAAASAFGPFEAGRYVEAFPIVDPSCGLSGVGFLRRGGGGDPAHLHRAYVKGIFVTDRVGSLAPEWGGFCRCVLNSEALRPTASRESLYEDETHAATGRAVASALMAYLRRLASEHPGVLSALLAEHELTFRKAALEDDAFFEAVIDLLEFESSDGWVRFGDFRREHETVRVASSSDQFRSLAPLARLRGLPIFNGGYVHHEKLLRKAAGLLPGMGWSAVSMADMTGGLGPAPDEDERALAAIAAFMEGEGFGVRLRAAAFEPDSVAGLYVEGEDEAVARSLDAAMSVADEPWTAVLRGVREGLRGEELGCTLCLNVRNGSVRMLLDAGPTALAAAIVRVIYVQALVEAHRAISPRDARVFSEAVGVLLRSGAGR